MEEQIESKDLMEEFCQEIENAIKEIKKDGINSSNLEDLYRLTDIHKDIKNEEYWKLKGESIMYGRNYRDYGDYGDNYGRRGVPGTGRGRRYRGEDALDEMKYHYGNYMESGSYGAKEDSSDRMVESFKKFIFSTAEELEPQDKMKLKRAMQEVMQELER